MRVERRALDGTHMLQVFIAVDPAPDHHVGEEDREMRADGGGPQ